ncbi:hypothetical protein BIZ37_30120, partial [Photobacterium sp. BZF1]|nr:hypothetical protein [Photobacterium sp. BZF1]
IHRGSTRRGNDESDSGQITVDVGSDTVIGYGVDIASFNLNNSLKSDNKDVSLVDSGNGLYQGVADNKVIFEYQLNANGSYSFEIIRPLDHSVQGKDSLNIAIPVYAIDQDGDKSANYSIDVVVLDDTPTVKDKNITVTEGRNSGKVDVLNSSGEGADDANVTAVIIDGVEYAVSGNNFNNNAFKVYDDSTPQQELGTVFFKGNGQVKFNANPDLIHNEAEITETITVKVTDGDGDIDTGIVTIKISDQGTSLTTRDSSGFEDNESDTDQIATTYFGIPISMDIDLGDADRGESIGTVTITPDDQMPGSFLLNGVVITPNGDGSVTIDPLAFSDTGDNVYSLNGVTFMPDEDFSTINGDLLFNVSAQVETSDGDHHSPMSGSFTVHVEGVADKPVWDDANSTYHYSADITEDKENVALNLTALLQDDDGNNTTSENLYYYLTIKEGNGTLVGNNMVETSVGSGVFKVAAADIDSIEVDPADNFSGDIKLDVYAQSQEKDNLDTAESVTKEIIINVAPDA